jgi:hypothetical protein
MRYLFVMNGAGIKMHDTLDQALQQARQWKASDLSRRVTVEEFHDHDFDKGYVRTYNDVAVESPMLVPALTPRHDFDVAPYGAFEVRIVETDRGFEHGFTVERVENGRVTGSTQQFATRELAQACLYSPAYTWLHHSDEACVVGCERVCWDGGHVQHESLT